MTYPSDPNQPYQYSPDQGGWAPGQPPNTGGFQPTQQQPAYGGQYDPASGQPAYGAPYEPAPQFGPGNVGTPGPAGPVPPKGKSKGLIAVVAALAVAVVGLGVGLIISLNRTSSASGASSTVTVTQPGGEGSTVTVTEPGAGEGETVTVTETETVEGGGGGEAEPTEEPGGGSTPSTGRIEGVVGEPLPLVFTDYDDTEAKYTLTVHTAEWKDALEGDYVDPPANAFLVLDVTIEVTEGAVDYSSYDWKAKDADGREYSDAFVFGSDLSLLSSGTVATGEKVRGSIVFDLPRGESSIIYSQGYGDLGVSYKIPA